MRLLLIALLGLPLLFTTGGKPEDAHPRWGIGVIYPFEENPGGSGHFPSEPVTYYASPGSPEPAGKCWQIPEDIDIAYAAQGDTHALPDEAIEMIGYEIFSLKVFAEANHRVAIRAGEGNDFIWLEIKDLERMGYRWQPWIDFMLRIGREFSEFPEKGLNLRTAPDKSAERVMTMNNDHYYYAALTGKRKGMWVQAVVRRFDEPLGGKMLQEWTGWFKAVDDLGFPNAWYAPKGC